MKRFSVFLCVIGLVFGFVSTAGALPYTATFDFWGTFDYNEDHTDWGAPAALIDVEYEADWWDVHPGLRTTYHWTLGVDVWGGYSFTPEDGRPACCEPFGFEHTFDLGEFALVELAPIYRFISGLAEEGAWGPFEWELELGLHEGEIDLAIWPAFLENHGIEALYACFEGELDLTYSRVPEASTMILLGFGLIGLAGFTRRKFKK